MFVSKQALRCSRFSSITSSPIMRFSVAAKRFPNEPTAPVIKTALPGPMSQKFIDDLAKNSCALLTQFAIDFDKACGSYTADTDGNLMLDVFMNIGQIPLGYNHPALLEAAKSDLMAQIVATRTGMGLNPPK